MTYAIEIDIFKEAVTFPNTENQTPNKEINQISPLCTSPWPAGLYITFGTVSMPNQTLHSHIYWCRESQGPDFGFSLQLFCFRVRSEVNIDKYCFVHRHYPLAPAKSPFNLLGFSAAF